MLKKIRRGYINIITKKFEDFIEQDISAVCISNKEGKIIRVNSKFCQKFEYKKQELLGLNVREIIPFKFRKAHDEGMQRHKDTNQSKVIGKGELELEGLKKNGEHIPIKLRLSKITIYGEDYFYATIKDLSEVKDRDTIIESISRFPEENPGLVLRVHKDGEISYANSSTKTFFKNISQSDKKRVLKFLRAKIDFICEHREQVNEEFKIGLDNYYVNMIPILEKYYFNVYATRITDYVDKVKHRESQLRDLSNELANKVEHQVSKIREKNKSLIENIRFAKTIQDAFELKALRNISSNFPVQYLNIAHSIVSGDFIWSSKMKGGKTFILFGDCTGHGVSASMVTVMVYSLLSQRLRPDKSLCHIMNALRDDIILLTAQELKYGVNVGLDGALISIDNVNDKLEYCGANISIYIQRADELKEYAANRFGISIEGSILENFESQTIGLQDGDVIYMASDGIRDQFGGKKDKKLKKKGFEQLLMDAGKQPFDQRSNFIKSFIKSWQGDNFQVDDQSIVCIEYKSQKLS